jgi:cytochrome oxidase Cu insertion factor (SCO1/SenC/PrrC family)
MKSIFSSAARLLALCALTSLSALAQPGSGGPTPGTTAPTAVPIDGGASLLLAGGVAFGLKQLRERRLARRATK